MVIVRVGSVVWRAVVTMVVGACVGGTVGSVVLIVVGTVVGSCVGMVVGSVVLIVVGIEVGSSVVALLPA